MAGVYLYTAEVANGTRVGPCASRCASGGVTRGPGVTYLLRYNANKTISLRNVELDIKTY